MMLNMEIPHFVCFINMDVQARRIVQKPQKVNMDIFAENYFRSLKNMLSHEG